MGFLDSYRRLSRRQRVFLGICGVLIGWYGPSWMTYVFLGSGSEKENTPSVRQQRGQQSSTAQDSYPRGPPQHWCALVWHGQTDYNMFSSVSLYLVACCLVCTGDRTSMGCGLGSNGNSGRWYCSNVELVRISMLCKVHSEKLINFGTNLYVSIF